MISFTKEQLTASAQSRIEFAEMMLSGELEPLKERTWTIELELARIALASLDAEPDYYVVVTSAGVWQSFCKTRAEAEFIVSKPFNPGYSVLDIYTAQPAPRVMKDHQIRELVNELRDITVEYHGTQQLRERIARTVCAAMQEGE
ncbi:Uncharacterised protein [Citrobacter freundii]|uniref:hypothetical protein n=1 Tax=Citrobacter freundii TaxID=546 RepID=UPI000DF0F4CE|nr:hypothetical protein [Citrobacter freundii]STB14262.1 Uncharacterised protein [Citrobacter freundii]